MGSSGLNSYFIVSAFLGISNSISDNSSYDYSTEFYVTHRNDTSPLISLSSVCFTSIKAQYEDTMAATSTLELMELASTAVTSVATAASEKPTTSLLLSSLPSSSSSSLLSSSSLAYEQRVNNYALYILLLIYAYVARKLFALTVRKRCSVHGFCNLVYDLCEIINPIEQIDDRYVNNRKIILHIYNLTKNNAFIPFGLGLYHSAIEIFGREYSFGSGCGIFYSTPKFII